MNSLKTSILTFICILLLMPAAASAANSILTDIFDGSESKIDQLPGNCSGENKLGYQKIGPVQVSVSGTYSVMDAFNFNGVDITAVIYEGNFFPNKPQVNIVTEDGIDVTANVELTAGTDYFLVVQVWCQPREGAWAVTFSGPGEVTADQAVDVLDPTDGGFSTNDPTADTACGNSQYQQIGPVQLARSGRYYYTDISINFAVDMCLLIYSAPFNPANPDANLIAAIDDFGSVELQSGTDYYLVVQPFESEQNGEYFFVFAPPALFRINTALAGGWFYQVTSGQGMFIDVLDAVNQLFVAWFTYDLERPDGDVTAMIGEPGHRWATAQGPFTGNKAELKIYWSSGMIFDSATPPPNDVVQDGEMTIEFMDCESALVDYDLGSTEVTGQFPMQRLGPDSVPLCESLVEGPGKPGPL